MYHHDNGKITRGPDSNEFHLPLSTYYVMVLRKKSEAYGPGYRATKAVTVSPVLKHFYHFTIIIYEVLLRRAIAKAIPPCSLHKTTIS